MTTYKNNIMYHVKERTATAVSPRLSLAAPAGGLPTHAQTDSLDEARVPRLGVHAVLECCAQAPHSAAQESHWTRVQPEIRGAGCIVRQ
jgi:hypothetical protein